MKIIFLIALFSINFQVFAEEKAFEKNGVTYRLSLHHELWVSSHCLQECLALKKPQVTPEISHSSNPAAEFCHKAQGNYQVVTEQSGLPESLCLFSDGSYIKAWDYYRKFKPNK